MLNLPKRTRFGLAAVGIIINIIKNGSISLNEPNKNIDNLSGRLRAKTYCKYKKRLINDTTKSIFELEKFGAIKKIHEAGEMYEITPKGLFLFRTNRAFIKERSFDLAHTPNNWDKKWRIIIFDIAVAENNLRNKLRELLKIYGFIYFQHSVWVYPYPCDDMFQEIKNILSVNDKAVYMIVEYMEGDAKLKRMFKLEV